MKKMNLLWIAAFTAFAISFTSCKKDNNAGTISTDNVNALQDDAQANNAMDDVDNEADDVVNTKGANLKDATADSAALAGRVIVWTTNNDGTITAVVTYTNFVNPKSSNDNVKNGVITMVITGTRSDNTYKRVVTFQNFTINGNRIEGVKTISKVADLQYNITLTDGKITFTDSSVISYTYNRTRTMIKGSATPLYVWDDAYTFEGSSSGVTRKGLNYTKTITKAITIYTAYKYPVSGTFDLTVGSKSLELDYGNGAFDALATITVDGVTKQITLRR